MPRELSHVETWEETSEVPLLLFAAAFLVAWSDLVGSLTAVIASWMIKHVETPKA